MKNRNNDTRSKQSSSLTSALGEPKRILFFCDRVEGRLAQILFENEARKMEVYWIALARCFSADAFVSLSLDNPQASTYLDALRKLGIEADSSCVAAPELVTTDDVQNANLIVVIQKSDGLNVSDSFAKLFPSLSVEKEIWTLTAEEESVNSLLQNVKTLLVRLILKGGKRAPVPIELTPSKTSPVPSGGKSAVRVRLESKGRRGKKVTVVFGLNLEQSELEKFASELKQTCGSGGAVKDDTVEIQGDQCERVLSELKRRGIQAKRSGG